jgi:hypothetical protein
MEFCDAIVIIIPLLTAHFQTMCRKNTTHIPDVGDREQSTLNQNGTIDRYIDTQTDR